MAIEYKLVPMLKVAGNGVYNINAIYATPQTYAPSVSGSANMDMSLSNRHVITMPAGGVTLSIVNVTVGQMFAVEIIQDGVGSRLVNWFPTIKWAGGVAPTLTLTASKKDSFIFVTTGVGTYDGYIIGQNV